jgi:predicted ABC-type sugar transport system permease subunit
MAFSLSRWRPRHLLLAWIAYWLVLLASVARPPLIAALRALSAPEGHGTMSAGMANGDLTFSVKTDALAWSGTASLTSIALWVTIPPLVMWAVWMVTRTRPVAASERTHERTY